MFAITPIANGFDVVYSKTKIVLTDQNIEFFVEGNSVGKITELKSGSGIVFDENFALAVVKTIANSEEATKILAGILADKLNAHIMLKP